MIFRFLPFLFIIVGVTSAALAAEGVRIRDAWIAPPFSQPNAAGYMQVSADEANAIVAAASDCCKAVELHTHRVENGVVRMRQVERIALGSEATVLAPGGLHLMLIGLKKPLADGDRVDITFTLDHGPDVRATFTVDRARLLDSIKSPKARSHH